MLIVTFSFLIPMKMLDHDVLATVVAVAETGNMTRAAEAVNRSQSAVSMQIKSLEDAIGRPLFVRKPRSIVLTREGGCWDSPDEC